MQSVSKSLSLRTLVAGMAGLIAADIGKVSAAVPVSNYHPPFPHKSGGRKLRKNKLKRRAMHKSFR